MTDIAARVGQNFGTNAELFAAVLDHVSEQAIVHLSELEAHHQKVDEWLRQFLTAEHLDHLHTAPMFGVLFENAHRLQFQPGVSAAYQRTVARVAEALASILQRGQSEGTIRADVPPLTLAWLVVSLIQARQFRRTFRAERSSQLERDLLEHVLDTFRPTLAEHQ